MSTPGFDLDIPSRVALEFDPLLQRIARYCATPGGRQRILTLTPERDVERANERLERVSEFGRWLAEEGRLVPAQLPGVELAVASLNVEGSRLEPLQLRDLATVLAAADRARHGLQRQSEGYPKLFEQVAALIDLRSRFEPILAGIDPQGALMDEASAGLRRLRRARIRVGERLRGQLLKMIRAPRGDSVFRDDFVTERNGRFVVPVRSDTPDRVDGIVHATSSSGATQFIEPLAAVELNNERVRLAEQEREEEERILLGWTEALREEAPAVRRAVASLEKLDTVQARAQWGKERRGTVPTLSEGGAFELRQARHPLLDERLEEAGERMIPLDIKLDPADRVLVVSGPNTGGKTVALKTAGLSVLMAQCGIPLCAQVAALPCYRQLRADIGDHQSIQADLSTFSAHVKALGAACREAAPPALMLFDELGTGTEPAEGAALGRAVLESLSRPGVTVIATTHLGELKAWSLSDPRAIAAAMEFDESKLRPTYRLLVGSAGISAGLDIAERLGVQSELIQAARGYLGDDERAAREYLAKLRQLEREAEERREELLQAKERFKREQSDWQQAQERERAKWTERAQRALDAELEQARKSLDEEVRSIRDRVERARAERKATQAKRRLAGQRRSSQTTKKESAATPELKPLPDEVPSGTKLWVLSLNREAIVAQDHGKQVEVSMGTARMKMRREDLSLVRPEAKPTGKATPGGGTSTAKSYFPTRRVTGEGRSAVADGVEQPALHEIILIGKRISEAEDELDRFLDRATLSGTHEVRIVHGHGTGRLRAAVREFLTHHPQVATWRAGDKNEGSDGATVARLS